MWNLKACTVCFSTGVKLYSLNDGTTRKDFNIVAGLQIKPGNGMPEYLCVECTAYVNKFKKFREKCHRAQYALQQILCRTREIKMSHLENFGSNQLSLMPTLSYMSLDKSHYLETQFQLVSYNRQGVSSPRGLIPVAHCSTLTNKLTNDLEMKVSREKDLEKHVKTEKETVQNENELAASEICKQYKNIVEYESQLENVKSSVNNAQYSSKSILQQALEMDSDTENVCGNDGDTFNTGDSDDNADNINADDKFNVNTCQLNNKVDGASVKDDYGEMIPISFKDAQAAFEVANYCTKGPFKCRCGKAFDLKSRYKTHCRRHDLHISGTYRCEICEIYFKTAFLRETHMSLQHMYKYLCRKCPEVMFTRVSAKQHFGTHLKPAGKSWGDVNVPSWLMPSNRGGRRIKGQIKVKPKRKNKIKIPKDFLVYTPQSQDEQYLLIQKRKETRNYLEAKFRCELCFRGFRLTSTYNKHMAKHDTTIAGSHMCDMCQQYFRNTRSLYKHMVMYHLCKYTCRKCDFITTNKGQAIAHYKWHKNVTYDCPHCDKKFNKISTQLTHIRFKHPGTDICNLCGHSFVSASGLNCHKIVSHNKEDIEASEELTANPDATSPFYCNLCNMQFSTEQAYSTHLGSSKNHVDTNISSRSMMTNIRRISRAEGCNSSSDKTGGKGIGRGRKRLASNMLLGSSVLNTGATTATTCEVCGKFLASDVLARRHYEAEHPGTDYLKRYMCDVCGHTTRQYANLLVHMRTHTREKPYGCPLCDRTFSMTSNRDRHLVVHTGEKRFQCQHCSRRFTQSTAVKLHIQTVHMKIPYKPWDKKNRKRRKEAQPTTAGVEVTEQIPVNVGVVPVPQHKLLIDPQEYITYISYAEEQ